MFHFSSWKLTGESDAPDFCQSAGTLEYPGYLSWVILKGYLGRPLAYVTPAIISYITMVHHPEQKMHVGSQEVLVKCIHF